MQQQKGFTLIELVMVIVILGILAAFALPKFANLGNDARVSVLKGAAGSVKSAAAIAHSKYLADGKTGGASVVLDGNTTVTMTSAGFPTGDDAGIGTAAQLSNGDFKITSGATATIQVLNNGNTVPNCQFTYDASTGTVSGLNPTPACQ